MPVLLAIMVVENEQGFGAALAEQMRLDPDFEVSLVPRPVRFERKLDPERVDLVIGFDTLFADIDALRASGYRGPFVHLGSVVNEIEGVETITLPLRVAPFIARIRSLVRTFKVRSEPWLTIGPYRLSLATRTLSHSDGTSQKLTDKEAEFLHFMHRARGEIVPREVLLADADPFPRDKPCGGGVTVRCANLLPFDLSPVVEHVVTGAVMGGCALLSLAASSGLFLQSAEETYDDSDSVARTRASSTR